MRALIILLNDVINNIQTRKITICNFIKNKKPFHLSFSMFL